MGEFVSGLVIGFFLGILLVAQGLDNYEKPTKWEQGGIISHKGETYYLAEIKAPNDKRASSQHQ